jgi:hypothetical protein
MKQARPKCKDKRSSRNIGALALKHFYNKPTLWLWYNHSGQVVKWKEIWGQVCRDTTEIWLQRWIYVWRLAQAATVHPILCSDFPHLYLKHNKLSKSVPNWWHKNSNSGHQSGIFKKKNLPLTWHSTSLHLRISFCSAVILWDNFKCLPCIHKKLCYWNWSVEGHSCSSKE